MEGASWFGEKRLSFAARLLILGLAYYVTAWLSLRVALVGQVVTPIWPPTGIALVGLLTYGARVWPAITVAALVVNIPINPSLGGALLIAAGNTLAPLVALGLLRKAGFRPQLDRRRDALALVVLGALVAMSISASFGTAALRLNDAIRSRDLWSTWSVWWAGDATGILVFAPLLLSWRSFRTQRWRRSPEPALVLVALIAASYFVFRADARYSYLLFPLLIWGAMRFDQLGASISALTVVALAVRAAIDKTGPFAHVTLFHRMLTLQLYDAVAALTTLVVAAVMAERSKAVDDLQALVDRERKITETLQRSLLPERLPDVPGVAFASRYLPGGAGSTGDVGGDWYDAFILPDGKIGLTIGDVVGRGLVSAAAMGQLRTALRAYALESSSPAAVVERLSRLASQFDAAQMATLIYAVLDPESGTVQFDRAGHPPPLLIEPDGTARYLDEAGSPPLGVMARSHQNVTVAIEPGSTLLFFTDGLVEPRRGSIDEALKALRAAVDGHDGDLDALCDDRVLRSPRPESPEDDVAVLAVKLLPMSADRLKLVMPTEPHVVMWVRRAVGQWLSQVGAHDDEIHDLLLATGEAATNVLEHAYGPAGGPLEIEATSTDSQVTIVVRDRGRWRSPRTDGRGHGLQLMHGLVDSLDITATAVGTEVHLRYGIGNSRARPSKAPIETPSLPSRSSEPIAIARPGGDIDATNAAVLFDDLIEAVGHEALGLVVDLSEVEHMDSAGIRLLYRVADRLATRRQGLRIVLPNGSPLRHALALSQVELWAPLDATVDGAVEELRAGSAT